MKPVHHSPEKVQGAVDVIVKGGLRGAAYGVLSGVAFHFAAQKWSPKYRGLTIQFRTFIQLAFAFTGACWVIDNGLLAYERKISYEQRQLRIKRMEEAVESGEYTYVSRSAKNKDSNDKTNTNIDDSVSKIPESSSQDST